VINFSQSEPARSFVRSRALKTESFPRGRLSFSSKQHTRFAEGEERERERGRGAFSPRKNTYHVAAYFFALLNYSFH